jgi:hypothetical protein
VIVPSRLYEVLIHHVDLDLGYRPQDWPAWFTNDMLSRTATSLTEGSKMPPVRLAGTDTGNVSASQLSRMPSGPLPDVPPIY